MINQYFIVSMNIRIGYACLNMTLRGDKTTPRISVEEPSKIPIFSNRSCIRKTIEKKGMDYLKDLCKKNVQDIPSILEWNEKHGIKFYRLSSMMLPHFTDPEVERFSMDFLKKDFEKIGEVADKYGHRLTFHPGQYNLLTSHRQDVVEKTQVQLSMHADILDAMNRDDDSVMIIHGGGAYGDKKHALERFVENFKKMPENVKRRLVLENDERVYSSRDLLPICEALDIPLVLDFHHYNIYPDGQPVENILMRALNIWDYRGITPKFHLSDQRPGARTGAHADYVEEIPQILFETAKDTPLDIMIEAKHKENSVFWLMNKYPELNIKDVKFT